jgi:hypothetical protein
LRALKLKALLAMAKATGENAQADDAVANNHDCGKNSVACQPSGVGPTGNHHGDYKRHLNNGDSQGEYERPEWLTETVRNYFGMVDCRKNGGDQSEGFGCGKWNARAKGYVDA